MPAMRAAVSHIFNAALTQHFVPAPPGCGMFELFGLDFMVDTLGRVPLIEVNSGPALCRHGRVLEDLIPRVIEEVFQKAVDVTFPPPEGAAPPEALHGFELVAMPSPPSVTATPSRGVVAASPPLAPPASTRGGRGTVREAVFACTEQLLERPGHHQSKAEQMHDSRMHSAVVDRLYRSRPERQHERIRAAAAVEAARALIRRSTSHLIPETEPDSDTSADMSADSSGAAAAERPPMNF